MPTLDSAAPAEYGRPRHRLERLSTYVAVAVIAASFAAVALRHQRVPVPGVETARRNARAALTGLNPNTATAAELAILPGIGDVKAAGIVAVRQAYRAEHADQPAFTRPEDLQRVSGIGPKTVDKLRPYLCFDD